MSKSEKIVVSHSGLTLFNLLTVLFVGLKFTDVIDWSWWWVLAPTLIPVGIGLVLLLVGLLIGGVVALFGVRR